jgi:hypothetical protein
VPFGNGFAVRGTGHFGPKVLMNHTPQRPVTSESTYYLWKTKNRTAEKYFLFFPGKRRVISGAKALSWHSRASAIEGQSRGMETRYRDITFSNIRNALVLEISYYIFANALVLEMFPINDYIKSP